MARTIAGTLSVPDTGPLANAEIYFVAKRNEATKILQGVSSVTTTDSSGNYSQSIDDGYYAVSLRFDDGSGNQLHRYLLGNVFIETGSEITLNALLAVNDSVADPTDAALQQLLADAQTARDEAVAAAASIEVMDSLTDTTAGRLMPVGAFGRGTSSPPVLSSVGAVDSALINAEYYVNNVPEMPFAAYGYLEVEAQLRTRVSQSYRPLVGGSVNVDKYVRFSTDEGLTWSGWRLVFNQGNILGSVSQSSAVPTGSVIERGSNSNGEYVKFADGTMICTKESGVILKTSDDTDPGNKSASWTYPASFANSNVSVNFCVNSGDAGNRGKTTAQSSSSNATLSYYEEGSNSFEYAAKPNAIGRWF